MVRERIQKLISASGICSRRRAEKLIRQGRVSINAQQAQLGHRADRDCDDIRIDGQLLRVPEPPRVVLLNKPAGVICSCRDPYGRITVLDLLPPSKRAGVHPVGRLDVNSRGALLLTNCGNFTLRVTHPRYKQTKVYKVWVRGELSEQALNRWRDGVTLDGRITMPAAVTIQHLDYQRGRSLLEVRLREGRNRQIRRIAEALGYPVQDLQRTAIGHINLSGLAEGRWRQLSVSEWHPLLTTAARPACD